MHWHFILFQANCDSDDDVLYHFYSSIKSGKCVANP